ncbi:hypothetical protein E2C06_30090 [Dankookia rubra]|uniref:Hedgehog/Intein (Hint) domain-containing protein n=1 Tax=Dankookia rubra TaxID=1442381 RepID=A0A4R5Q7M0_9PROT|nr:Hint domain-containing protein [Dankookia rubra]TDH58904.1 hypothetical protein E2C06_30090 [Dankookia rubra]
MATQNGTGVSGLTSNGAKTVTNPFGTQVSGSVNGIQISPGGTVTNAGGIAGIKGSGVLVNGSGTVNDLDGATITGGMNGVKITGAGTVNNAGSITGTQGFGTYVGGAGTVNNTGSIDSAQGFGTYIAGAGTVHNAAGASIDGAVLGVDIIGSGHVDNAGSITGVHGAGILIGGAGQIVNAAGGTLTGQTYGAEIVGLGTLENAGTIDGGLLGAAYLHTASSTLIVHPDAVFDGTVTVGGTGDGIMELTSGGAGTLDGIGTDFVGFETVTIAPDASWTIGGTLDGLEGVTIKGFNTDDGLVLQGLDAGDTATLGADNLVTIRNAEGEVVGTVQLDAAAQGHPVSLVSDGQGGTTLLLCYLEGTRILTPTGEVAIEDLRIGDTVVTRFQGIQPIKWIGRQSFAERFLKGNRDRIPVRIKAGALGDRIPARDLSVSPGHSMLVGDRLVLARSLVNGVTILQDHAGADIHYHQIELETHDCIIADGAWSETYADCEGQREQFHNVAEFHALYPDHRPPEELSLCAPRPERGAKLDAVLRPVVARAAAGLVTGPLKGSIDRIRGEWKIEGWAQDPSHPELPVLLEVLLEDRVIGSVLACDLRKDLQAAGIGQGRCSFVFTSPVRLRPEALGTLRIRRAADGAEIRMSASCRDGIGAPAPAGRLQLVA